MDESFQPRPFGRYTLLRKIAAGGMGELFLAKLRGPAGFEKLLAIKCILEAHADRDDFVDMFFAEARLVAKLTHRNIVPIYELGKHGETHYVVMEYVPGRSAGALVDKARSEQFLVPPSIVVEIGTQACDGLAYAHSARDNRGPLNLIHRDVSPRNILIGYAGDVKIIDFGVAKSRVSNEQTEAGIIKGKLSYMSPEQCTAQAIDGRSDIFSLGVCLYELCTQIHPFLRGDKYLTFHAIQTYEPPPLANFEPRYAPLDPIVERALAKSPDQRYPSCEEMRKDLQRVLRSGRLAHEEESLSRYISAVFAREMEEDSKTEISAVATIDDEPTPEPFSATPRQVPLPVVLAPAVRPRLAVALGGLLLLTVLLGLALHSLGVQHGHAWARSRNAASSMVEPLRFEPATSVAPAPENPPKVRVPVADLPSSPSAPPVASESPSVPPPETRSKSARVNGRDGTARSSPKAAVLTVRAAPLPGDRSARRASRGIELRQRRGSVTIGSGKDAKQDPFRVTLSYQLYGDRLSFRIESEPWAVVQNEISSGLGKTPIDLVLKGRSRRVRLVNPPQGRNLELFISLQR